MPRVLVVQTEVKHYRLSFFNGLHAALQQDGIELKVVYSNSNPVRSLRKDDVELPAHIGCKVSGHWFFKRFIYQPIWKEIYSADLVITGSEIKYLINPLLLLMSALKLKRVAFWGLGPNKFPTRSAFAEMVKRPFFTGVDWWFAYTESIAEYLRSEGMPGERITNVQNATDTWELRRMIDDISDAEARDAKVALSGSADSRIGFFCGMLREIKAIPLLIEAARLAKRKCPEFHLVVIGDGPERAWLEDAIANEPWIHYLGPKFGRDTALYYKIADLFLLAGTAGLAVVDTFAAGLPLLVTDLPTHPPEISYVVDGENGRITPHEPEAFAAAIVETLSDSGMMERLRRGARESSARYTIEAMIDNYRTGIKKCLALYGLSRILDVAELPAAGTKSC
jgi:L-malate glycosyltransferase